MKFNKWTLGLAAVGVVSLASVAQAEEKMSAVQTALSNTTISGYISASANVALTDDYASSPAHSFSFQPVSKQDGFNLDVVKLSISKPEDESPWASGYQADLIFGPDAVGYNSSVNGTSTSDFGIKQAYVSLRTPVGNGIDWKIGVFDTLIGYEVFDAGSNPNYTRSWGYTIEPTEHTGVLGTYKINDEFSVSGGIANTLAAGINARNTESGNPTGSDWHKTFLGSVTFTAPSSWGWAAGSGIYAGAVYGFGNASTYSDGNQVNYYAGATLNTPLKELTGGLAFDYVRNSAGGSSIPGLTTDIDEMSFGAYSTYKFTDKLSLSTRGEYVEADTYANDKFGSSDNLISLTGTVEYDLWVNVVSRVEVRWDHDLSDSQGTLFAAGKTDAVGLYANIIYKF